MSGLEKYMGMLDEIYLMEVMTELSYEIFHQGQKESYVERAAICDKIADVELALDDLKQKLKCNSEVEALKKRGRENGRKNVSAPNRSVWL